MYDELIVPPRVLLGPGPSEANTRVLKAMTTPMLGYLDTKFVEVMDDTVALLREVFGTKNRLTLPVSGTGTAGMEAALANVVEPGDGVVVGINGYFGERIANIAARCGGVVRTVEAEWGTHISAEKIAEAISKISAPKLVALVHGETSTGILQPLTDAIEIARSSGALFLADCVTSLGGQPVDMDARGIDIAYSCTQKCLAGPPGLSPISFSERAVDVIRNRKTPIQSFYLDMTLLEKYWQGEKRSYHHTVSMSMIYALREALRVVLEEGLAARYERHELNARALLAGAKAIGLQPAAEQGYRAPMLTTLRIPDGIDDATIRKRLITDYGIEIGAGLGIFAGKAWRIGLMGESTNERNIMLVLNALEKLLIEFGHNTAPGTAVHAASQVY
ncbi:alanine--glyoxylate aminotransferase family protein [Candidatus Poribacteria bacterium]|nr:alanine--glyoxylate aminotransferase family protein [Candidatus Poribacteria bacterium]MYH84195.1 alanine--glyoxylate aminotransferase family protein [Candidatus Poribacteria bacterium]MYK94667.1 alanine--glyoxylate aminotransferase family protein [Candidatus Poribacteria bacterium]